MSRSRGRSLALRSAVAIAVVACLTALVLGLRSPQPLATDEGNSSPAHAAPAYLEPSPVSDWKPRSTPAQEYQVGVERDVPDQHHGPTPSHTNLPANPEPIALERVSSPQAETTPVSAGRRVTPVSSATTSWDESLRREAELIAMGVLATQPEPSPRLPFPIFPPELDPSDFPELSELDIPQHAESSGADGSYTKPTHQPASVVEETAAVRTGSDGAKSPPLADNFLALPQSAGMPPDTMGAAGINHLMATLNDRIRIFLKNGTVVSTVTLRSFFDDLPGVNDVFDPRIYFDSHSHRYFFTATVQRRAANSGIVLAVSATSDPTGLWHKWHFEADPTNVYWADYPYLGGTIDKITVAANMFRRDNDAFYGNEIWVFDKETALDGGVIVATQFQRPGVPGLCPVITFDTTTTQYIVQKFFHDLSGLGYLQLWTFTGSADNPVLSVVSPRPVSDAWNFNLLRAPQLGSSNRIDTGDDRILNAVLRDGRIWTTQNVRLPKGGTVVPQRSAAKWWEINAATATTVQSGVIEDPTNNFFYMYPSITINANSEVLIGFSGSSASTYVGCYYAYRNPSTPMNQFEPVAQFKEGLGPYSGSRWGDYSATMVDPVDDLTIWTIQEWADGGNRWSTWWGKYAGGSGDTTPPQVQGATAPAVNRVRITFNEAMADNAALVNPANYTFTGGGAALTAQSVTRLGATQVDVTTTVQTSGAAYGVMVAAAVTDLAGNGVNPSANTASFTGNTTPLTISLTSTVGNPGEPTNVTPIPVTATFSVPVTGFTQSDLVLTNASVSNFTNVNGSTYTFNLTPNADGVVSAHVPAGSAMDAGGNQNQASNTLNRILDTTRPTVQIGTSVGDPTNQSPIPITVSFNEPVTGFTASDVSVTNGSVQAFNAVTQSAYTFNVLPGGNGTVTVAIPADVAQDLAGNFSLAATPLSRFFDGTAPGVMLSSTAPATTNETPIPVMVAFTEPVTGFTQSAIATTNATIMGFTGSGANYTFDLIPSGQGVVTASVPSGVVSDAAGNVNTASGVLSRTFDTEAPTVVLSSSAPDPTNTSPIPLLVTFNEAVTGFTVDDIAVSNGTKGNFTNVNGAVYTLTITPAGQGAVTATVGGGVAQDAAGNPNEPAPQFSRTFDTVRPSVAMSSTSPNPTNSSPIPVTVTFSESVTGFTMGDISATNGSVGNFNQVSGAAYTFTLTPSSQGLVSAGIAANVAQDSAGNLNTAASTFSRTFDTTSPNVVIATTVAALTNQSPIPVSVTFSENVTGFTANDLDVTNGTVSGFSGSGAAYSFNVAPQTESLVTIRVPENTVQDAAGNQNSASNQLSITFDATPPDVTIVTSAPNPTNTTPIPFDVTFSESVVGFAAGSVSVTNGTIGNFTGSGAAYTFTITPAAQGLVTVAIPNGAARDGAGNNNNASSSVTRTFDNIAPSLSLTSAAANPTNSSPIPVTASFSEPVSGFAANDLNPSNATVGNFVAVTSSTYTFSLTPISAGAVSVTVSAGAAQDSAQNPSAAAVFNINYDNIAPTILMSSSASLVTNLTSIPVTVTFSEPVLGFTASDIVTSNATVSNFTGSGANYAFTLSPSAQGLVTADVPAGRATDTAGNSNMSAPQFSRVFDSVNPTAALSSTAPNPTNTSPIAVSVTFSEAVTGFSLGDITTVNASATNLAGSGATYTFDLVPSTSGSVSATVPAGAVTDAAGNGNTASNTLTRTFDSANPAVTMSSTAGNPTNLSPITVTVTFTKSVTGFTGDDIMTANASLTNFSGSGTSYAFSLTPLSDGPVTADIPAGAAQDSAGNLNDAAPTFLRTYDGTPPAAAMSTTAANPTNSSPIPITVTFSEPVTGFTASDLGPVTNGSISSFSGSGASYKFNLTPTAQGMVSVALSGGVATDSAGNVNTAAPTLTRTFDSIAPTVMLASNVPEGPTNVSPIPITIKFSEPVTGFIAEDLNTVNANVTAFSGSGANYSASLVPVTQGAISVNVPAGVAQDAAGNSNTAAADSLDWIFDNTNPSVVMESAEDDPTNAASFTVDVIFSSPVTGFTLGDIAVANGTASSLSGSGANYSFTLTPTADGLVTVDIPAGVAMDASSNPNSAAPTFTRTLDTQAPAVTISSSAAPGPTRVSPIPFTVTFSEDVIDFAASDLNITNGSGGGFSGGGSVYTFNVTPASQGTVTINIAANTATDLAGNGNSAAAPFNIVFDTISPTVTMTSGISNPTNMTPIPVTVTFSESVTGFTNGDVLVSNATLGNFSGSGGSYSFELTPANQGLVTANIPSGAATDAAGNPSASAPTFSRTFDTTRPSAVLSSLEPDPTGATSFPVTVTFSESVTGFTLGDITVSNANASGLSGSGAVYSFTLSPASPGLVTAAVQANAAQDAAGNLNTASSTFSRTFDNAAPTVTLSTTAPDPTNQSPVTITATFSKSVTGVSAQDLQVTNATVPAMSGSGATYTFSVVPANQGAVTALYPAGQAQDSAGNSNLASNQLNFDYDTQGPTIQLAAPGPNPTRDTPIPFIATFNEPPVGFTASDLTLVNATLDDFRVQSPTVFEIDLNPMADGVVSLAVAEAVTTDAAGNDNSSAGPRQVTFDSTSPTVLMTSTAPDPATVSPIPVTVTFNEPVTGFTSADITPIGATINNFTVVSGSQYTLDLVPTADGPVSADIGANAATDEAGNPNLAASTFSRIFDGSVPTVVLTTSAPDPTNVAPIPVTATFSESVTGFNLDQLNLTNSTAGDLAGSGAVYTFSLMPESAGLVRVRVRAGNAVDIAGNGNPPSNILRVVYDPDAPSVSLTSTAPTTTNTSPIPLAVAFSKSVAGFTLGDIMVLNGTAQNLSGSGSSYTAEIVPAAIGLVTVSIPAGAAVDSAQNGNIASNVLTRTFDNQSPDVTLASSAPPITNLAPIPVQVTFTKPVTGFTIGDVTANNATLSNFAGSGAAYSFDLNPTVEEGAITVEIAAGVATDAAGNTNTPANPLTRDFDGRAPTAVMSSPTPNRTNLSPIPVEVTFSEPVTGFSSSDVVLINATLANFAGSDADYTFDLIPAADGPIRVDIPGAAAFDAAGNGNVAPAPLRRTFDATPPTVTMTTNADPNDTTLRTVAITATFSEPVTGFTMTSLSPGADTGITDFEAVTTAIYTFNATATAEPASIEVTIAAGAATDLAGNQTEEDVAFSRQFTGDLPQLVMTSPTGNPTNITEIEVIAIWSEPVTGFTQTDINVVNASLDGFTQTGPVTYTFSLVDLTVTDGEVTATVPAGTVLDNVGNPNPETAIFSRTIDNTPPTFFMSSTLPGLTNAFTIPVVVTFSEPITGFQPADIQLDPAGGAITNFVMLDSVSTLFFWRHNHDVGAITATIPAMVLTDIAGNPNTNSESFTINVDTVPPMVESIVLDDPSPTRADDGDVTFTVTFSEPVTGVDLEPPFNDFALISEGESVLAEAVVSDVEQLSAQIYRVTADTGPGSGTLQLAVLDESLLNGIPNPSPIRDAAGNVLGEHVLDGPAYDIDRIPPEITISLPAPRISQEGPVVFVVTYTGAETISLELDQIGVVSEDFDIHNLSGQPAEPTTIPSAGDKQTISPPPFDNNPEVPEVETVLFEVGPEDNQRTVTLIGISGNGQVGIFIPAGTAVDALGNAAEDKLSELARIDKRSPTVNISLQGPVRTNSDSVNFNVTFDEPISSFSREDVTVTGSLAQDADVGIGGVNPNFVVSVTPRDPNADGTIGIRIAGTITDDAGNVIVEHDGNLSSPLMFTIDNTPPAVSISAPSVEATRNGPVSFIVNYTKDPGEEATVTLAPSDVILVRNGTAFANVAIETTGPLQRVVTLRNIIGDGSLAIALRNGTARDSVGNRTPATMPSESFIVDNTPLTMLVSPPSTEVTRTGPVSYIVTYLGATEITLGTADIELVREGTADGRVNVAGVGTTQRTITISNITGQGSLTINIDGGTAHDLVGDLAPPFGPAQSFRVDDTAPAVAIGPPSRNVVNTTPVAFTVTYSDADTVNLRVQDVALNRTGTANATIQIAGSGNTTRTVTLNNITGDGTIGISILAGTAVDSAGTSAPASAPSQLVTVDNTRPEVRVNQAQNQPDPADFLPIVFEARFTENVTGFTASDVIIEGSAEGAVVAVDGSAADYRILVLNLATQGTVRVSVRANAAQDAAGNQSLPSTSVDNEVMFTGEGVPACDLTEVHLLAPASGGTIFLAPGAMPAPLTLSAVTDCPADTFFVEFNVNGLPAGMADSPPYAITIADALGELGPGVHSVTATATSLHDPGITFEDTRTFTIVEAGPDLDTAGNGLPDDPFNTLVNDGDTWIAAVQSPVTGATRLAGAVTWNSTTPAAEPVAIAMQSPSGPLVRMTVTVPRGLVQAGETAVLLVLFGDSPDTLFDQGVDLLGPEPESGLVIGGHYLEISIIVSTGGGFTEIDPQRLLNHPIRLLMSGLDTFRGGNDRFYAHPTEVTMDNNGLVINVMPGEWQTNEVFNTRVFNGYMEGTIVGLSLLAPFQGVDTPEAVINITPASLSFGDVPVNQEAEAQFTVRNIGNETLSGAVAVSSPFSVVSGGVYNIPPGEEHNVRIRFRPTSEQNFTGVAQFSGGGGQTVSLGGRGVRGGGGCGSRSGASGFQIGDLLLLMLLTGTLLALSFRGKRV